MMAAASNSRLITIVAHALAWVLFAIAIFFYHPLFSGIDIPFEAWIKQAITLCLLVIIFYVNTALLVPRLLLKRPVAYYIAMLLALVLIVAVITAAVNKILERQPSFEHASKRNLPGPPIPQQGFHPDRPTIIITALVLGIGTSLTVIQKWQADRQLRGELEKERLSTELSFLRAQVNPHFFFNTMNNIYALTETDAALAGRAIHQLSRMMRYLLYDTPSGDTLLSKEIAFIKDYFSLAQLRFTTSTTIDIKLPDHLQDLPIAPMLLLPFIENACKHGVSAVQEGYIECKLEQRGTTLDLTVKNSVLRHNNSRLNEHSGIGLVNTRRRLDLLYPGKYQLEIEPLTDDKTYSVHLVLDLS